MPLVPSWIKKLPTRDRHQAKGLLKVIFAQKVHIKSLQRRNKKLTSKLDDIGAAVTMGRIIDEGIRDEHHIDNQQAFNTNQFDTDVEGG